MAKLDNTHQIIENIVGARLDEINGELVFGKRRSISGTD